MTAIILGLPNHTSQSYSTATTLNPALLEPADMPASNLKTEEPTDIGRIKTLDPALTQWVFGTSLLSISVDGLAVENHNLTLGGQIRFLGDITGGNAAITPSKAVPSSIISSSNRTGAVTAVDEDVSSPDGSYMQPTSPSSPWNVTLKFFALSGTIDTGTDKMCFVVRAAKQAVGAGAVAPVTLPAISASIPASVSSTGLVKQLGYRAVTNSSTNGQFFIFPFSRADFLLTTDLQVTLSFTTGTSASGGQFAVLEAVSCFYETITLSTPAYDSGWLNIPGDSRPAPVQPVKRFHYFPDTPWANVLAYGMMFRSDQTQHDPPLDNNGRPPVSAIVTPVDYVQAGTVVVGEAEIIDDAFPLPSSPGSTIETVEVSSESIVGKSYSADAFRRTLFDDPIELIVNRDQLLVLQDQLAFRRGHSGAFYVALEPGVEMKYQQFTSGLVVCTGMSKPEQMGQYYPDGRQLYKVSLRLEQKL